MKVLKKMMPVCRRNYHEFYNKTKHEHDKKVIEYISQKEEIVCAHPFDYPLLKHDFNKIRRAKCGKKLRIFYAMSTERPDLWDNAPDEIEIIFL